MVADKLLFYSILKMAHLQKDIFYQKAITLLLRA
jgi:hypothetical protein